MTEETRKEMAEIVRYVSSINSCLFPKGYTQDTITVAIIAHEREEFDDALYDVKSLGGKYDPVKKQWTIRRPRP